MGQGVRLLFVRHGESVDNAAGVYPNIAGSRDSALSAHGALQARCLAKHLAERPEPLGAVTHIFASDLQRAWQTAEAIRDQLSGREGVPAPSVVRLVELREKHFGSMEGVKFGRPIPGLTNDEEWEEPESSESVRLRVGRFLDDFLLPIIIANQSELLLDDVETVVVAAHGVVLSHLVKALLTLFRRAGSPIAGVPLDETGSRLSWRNTGYFECLVVPVEASTAATRAGDSPSEADGKPTLQNPLCNLGLNIVCVNSVDHLAGVRKTRGGIGSAAFDSSQKTLDSFFPKKQT